MSSAEPSVAVKLAEGARFQLSSEAEMVVFYLDRR